MKKSLSIILALVIALSLSVTAFAAETNEGSSPTDITVNGTFVSGTAADEKISVDIVWDAMDFTYTAPSQGTWNPATHAYDGATTGGWSDNNPAITVKNHSNADIYATLDFTTDVTGIVGTFTEASGTENDSILELATAVGTEVANAPTATANFGISGAAIDADKALGTITVTIAKVVEATTYEALQAAVENGGLVKLGGDITLSDNLYTTAVSPLVLDLNGYTITGSNYAVWLNPKTCTIIRGGSITSEYRAVLNNGGTLTIDQCTISAGSTVLVNDQSTAVTTVKNSTLISDNGAIDSDRGSVSLEGTVKLSGEIYGGEFNENVTVLAGTYSFDPTSYVDADTYTVNYNDYDDTWTVASK